MTTPGFHLFETAIGCCGLAWGERGLIGTQLPESSAAIARARLARRFPAASEQAPPSAVAAARDRIAALLGGEADDLADIVLDLTGVAEFEAEVYRIVRTIPPGATLGYGEIARRLGRPEAARAVGRALGRNPFPIVVPCHRVLAAGGKPGGFSASGGIATKRRLLWIESVHATGAPTLFDRTG